MLEFLLHDAPRLRKLPLGREGIAILKKNHAFVETCHTLLQHDDAEMVKEGLQIIRNHYPQYRLGEASYDLKVDTELIDRLLNAETSSC